MITKPRPQKVKVQYNNTLDIAPLRSESPPLRYGTCSQGMSVLSAHPHVHPQSEWAVPAFAFPVIAGTHLLTPEGWKAELAWMAGYLVRQFTCPISPLLTGLNVDQLRWSRPTCYRYTKLQNSYSCLYSAMVKISVKNSQTLIRKSVPKSNGLLPARHPTAQKIPKNSPTTSRVINKICRVALNACSNGSTSITNVKNRLFQSIKHHPQHEQLPFPPWIDTASTPFSSRYSWIASTSCFFSANINTCKQSHEYLVTRDGCNFTEAQNQRRNKSIKMLSRA